MVLWGLRMDIPPLLQERLLEELHEEHPGMFWMKALARSFMWWPGLDQQIEWKVRSCSACTTTDLDMANETLAASTHGLCRA